MKWKLSDGTVVHLGGLIEGESSVAERLRNAVALIALGLEPFDLDDSAQMHAWVHECAQRAGMKVVESPYDFEVVISGKRGEHKVVKSPDPRAKLLPAEKEFVRFLVREELKRWEREQRGKSERSE
jgi:hypothetical protein